MLQGEIIYSSQSLTRGCRDQGDGRGRQSRARQPRRIVCHHGERWHAQMRFEGCKVVRHAGEARIDAIGDPAREREPPLPNGRRGEQRMIQATEPQTHHQQHRQIERGGQIRDELLIVERGEPAAGAFDDHAVRGRT